MSKAVIFFAPGLEECEGLLCVDILRRAGVEVTIAAVGGEKIVKSARQISVVADALAEELDYTVFDACTMCGFFQYFHQCTCRILLSGCFALKQPFLWTIFPKVVP